MMVLTVFAPYYLSDGAERRGAAESPDHPCDGTHLLLQASQAAQLERSFGGNTSFFRPHCCDDVQIIQGAPQILSVGLAFFLSLPSDCRITQAWHFTCFYWYFPRRYLLRLDGSPHQETSTTSRIHRLSGTHRYSLHGRWLGDPTIILVALVVYLF